MYGFRDRLNKNSLKKKIIGLLNNKKQNKKHFVNCRDVFWKDRKPGSAAFGHGRWHLWFSRTYEGNMSLSIPQNMRMTTRGMLRLTSHPGTEPNLNLLQETTNVAPPYPMRYQCFKTVKVSTQAGPFALLRETLTLRPVAGDAHLQHSSGSWEKVLRWDPSLID